MVTVRKHTRRTKKGKTVVRKHQRKVYPIKLTRVFYSKPTTPKHLREYRILSMPTSPVGTKKKWTSWSKKYSVPIQFPFEPSKRNQREIKTERKRRQSVYCKKCRRYIPYEEVYEHWSECKKFCKE
jgi:hypothetical protein